MMMKLLVLSLIFGAALGLRFNVLILLPAILLSLTLNAGIAAAQGYGLWDTLLATALSITGIQIGFLGGFSSRYFITAWRSPPLRGAGDRPTAAASGPAR
jgi:hypothetical protein